MGLMSYFKTSTKDAAKDRPTTEAVVTEKAPGRNSPTSQDPRGPYLNPLAAGSSLTVSSRASRTSYSSVDVIKFQVILNHIWQKQNGMMWIEDTVSGAEGVMIRRARGEYLCKPNSLHDSDFARAMSMLNVQAAMTIKSAMIEPFLTWNPEAVDVPLRNGLRVQLLQTLNDLPRARRHQYAAFIAKEAMLVVWDDDPTQIFDRAKAIEDSLLDTVWQMGKDDSEGSKEKGVQAGVIEIDEEAGMPILEERPTMYFSAFLSGCSICFLCALMGLAYAEIALEVVVLKHYISLAYLAMTPVNLFLSLFFANICVGVVAQLIGPIQQLSRNSKFFSAKPPPRILGATLPHVTIQCPVYKEGLHAVIAPTVYSIKKAISTYELQGGSANILIHDDGLQLMDEESRKARIDFYSDHGIGWTARPANGKDGYIRKGKFKKASNMNFGLKLSNEIEERLALIPRSDNWSQVDEVEAFEECMQSVLNDRPEAWAEGNIRLGDYILIIDSDTQVPEDCLLDAAMEMEQSPNVGIIQFSSGVMQVSHNFFENGITFFTNLIYSAIRYGVANGDVAAFVGHNAILRWSAVQAVAFDDEEGIERFWTESCVSEDFDMALRLQLNGYIIRMAAWAGDGFKEGVSLTVYDELTRWQKYAYGCNELVFNPIRTWLWKSPFTPLFRSFICSNMAVGSKMNIVAYIGTYYALGCAWILTAVNYVVIGLYNGYLDKAYLDSWRLWVAIVVVFSVAGNVGLAVQRHRSGEKSFLSALFENFCWALMFTLYFGGLSVHMSQAILCHMFEIDMTWGATSKEVEFSNFFLEVPKVLKAFKYTFAMAFFAIAAMIIMAVGPFIPWSYNIDQMVAIFPLAIMCASHILLPIALNPEMMTFSW